MQTSSKLGIDNIQRERERTKERENVINGESALQKQHNSSKSFKISISAEGLSKRLEQR